MQRLVTLVVGLLLLPAAAEAACESVIAPTFGTVEEPSCDILVDAGGAHGTMRFERYIGGNDGDYYFWPANCATPPCNRLFYEGVWDGYSGAAIGVGNCTSASECARDGVEAIQEFETNNVGGENWLMKGITVKNVHSTSNSTNPHLDAIQTLQIPETDGGWFVMQNVTVSGYDQQPIFQSESGVINFLYQDVTIEHPAGFDSDCQTRKDGPGEGQTWGGTRCGLGIGAVGGTGAKIIWLVGVTSHRSNALTIGSGFTDLIRIQNTNCCDLGGGWTGTTHDFATIEDAIDAGWAQPPFIELSNVGWATPPPVLLGASCTGCSF